jgi:hypothetical protein
MALDAAFWASLIMMVVWIVLWNPISIDRKDVSVRLGLYISCGSVLFNIMALPNL